MKRTLVVAVLAATVSTAAAGCANDSSSSATSRASTTTADPFSDTYTPAPAQDIPGKVVVRGVDSSCRSTTGSTAGVALTGVDVHLGVAGYAGTAARVTWKVTTPLPTNGTVLLSLLAASQDGSTTRQLGWKTQNGQQVSYFVFESYTQRSLDGYPDTRVPNEVSGVLPSGDVEALGDNWHWSATLNVDGEDVAACPG